MIQGCDVSFYQDKNETARKIDFGQMRAAGAEFVYIRAGQGIWKDPDFDDYMRAAKAAGLLRGVYFLYDYRRSVQPQIKLMMDVIRPDWGELPPWLDVERVAAWVVKPTRSLALPAVKEMLAALETLGPKPILYTNPDTMLNYLSPIPDWLLEYRLAVAHYGAVRPITGPWVDWTFWQYSDRGDGALYGTESKQVDMDYFNGDAEELRSLASSHQPARVGLAEWARAADNWLVTQGYPGPRLAE